MSITLTIAVETESSSISYSSLGSDLDRTILVTNVTDTENAGSNIDNDYQYQWFIIDKPTGSTTAIGSIVGFDNNRKIILDDIDTWGTYRLFCVATHTESGEQSETNPLKAPESNYINITVTGPNYGLEKPAAGQRNWFTQYRTLVDTVENSIAKGVEDNLNVSTGNGSFKTTDFQVTMGPTPDTSSYIVPKEDNESGLGLSNKRLGKIYAVEINGDLTGSLLGNVDGNANTATSLATTRVISLSGSISGSTTFDGSGDGSITVTINERSVSGSMLNETGVTAGSYGNTSNYPIISVDSEGRITDVSLQSLDFDNQEAIQDAVATLFTEGSHAIVSASYDDANNRIDLTLTGSLKDISELSAGNGNFIVGDGSNWTVESSSDARTSLGLGTVDSPTFDSLTLTNYLTSSLLGDVTGSLKGNVDGNVTGTATSLATTRVISLSGSISGSTTFDGSGDGSITVTINERSVSGSMLNETGVTAQTFGSENTYPIITVDAEGRITTGSNQTVITTATDEDVTTTNLITRLAEFDQDDLVNIGDTGNDTQIVVRGTLYSSGSITLESDKFFDGDLEGAVTIKVKNNTTESLSRGKAVYLTGGSTGDIPHVDYTVNTSTSKMPAIGIIKNDIAANNEGYVVTSGIMNDSNHNYTVGDNLYISPDSGELTATAPSGENKYLQKIGKAISSNHILVQGAFRTNAVPNLNNGNIFIGNSSGRATIESFTENVRDVFSGSHTIVSSSYNSSSGQINLTLTGSLKDISELSVGNGNFIVGDGSNWTVKSGSAARTSLGLGTGDSPTFDSLTVSGDLTVSGETTTINTATVEVEDKNIVLGAITDDSPTDTSADGGGLTLSGSTDKTFNWVNSTDSWTSSEHIDLASGKVFKVGETEVLSATTLGSGVVNSSLTSVGTLDNLTVSGFITGSLSGSQVQASDIVLQNHNSTTSKITTITDKNLLINPDGELTLQSNNDKRVKIFSDHNNIELYSNGSAVATFIKEGTYEKTILKFGVDNFNYNDAAADGSGIVLNGSTDKTFKWIDSTDSWTSSEHMDLASGKVFKIGETEVLSSDTLGSGVVSSSLTSVGTLTDLEVAGDLVVSGSIISPENNNLTLSTSGTGNIVLDSTGGDGVIQLNGMTVTNAGVSLLGKENSNVYITSDSNQIYTIDADGNSSLNYFQWNERDNNGDVITQLLQIENNGRLIIGPDNAWVRPQTGYLVLQSYEDMYFDMDINNNESDTKFYWRHNATSGGTEIMSLDSSGGLSVSGFITGSLSGSLVEATTLKIDGTPITATAGELNQLDGISLNQNLTTISDVDFLSLALGGLPTGQSPNTADIISSETINLRTDEGVKFRTADNTEYLNIATDSNDKPTISTKSDATTGLISFFVKSSSGNENGQKNIKMFGNSLGYFDFECYGTNSEIYGLQNDLILASQDRDVVLKNGNNATTILQIVNHLDNKKFAISEPSSDNSLIETGGTLSFATISQNTGIKFDLAPGKPTISAGPVNGNGSSTQLAVKSTGGDLELDATNGSAYLRTSTNAQATAAAVNITAANGDITLSANDYTDADGTIVGTNDVNVNGALKISSAMSVDTINSYSTSPGNKISLGTNGKIQFDIDNNDTYTDSNYSEVNFRRYENTSTVDTFYQIQYRPSDENLIIIGPPSGHFYTWSYQDMTWRIDRSNTSTNYRYRWRDGGNDDIMTLEEDGTLSLFPTSDGGLEIYDDNSSNYWRITAKSNLAFNFNNTLVGGYLDDDANVGQIDFTGQHRSFPAENDFVDLSSKVGLIAVSSGEYKNISDDIESQKPSINEALPKVRLSSYRNQKSVYGVVSNSEDPNDNQRKYKVGNFVSTYEKPEGDNRLIINSLGEGGIWITNINGDLENGDYITTCEIPGYGMKQDDDLLHNYTVAKITCDCNFDLNSTIYNCEEFIHEGVTYRRAFVGCTYHCG